MQESHTMCVSVNSWFHGADCTVVVLHSCVTYAVSGLIKQANSVHNNFSLLIFKDCGMSPSNF